MKMKCKTCPQLKKDIEKMIEEFDKEIAGFEEQIKVVKKVREHWIVQLESLDS